MVRPAQQHPGNGVSLSTADGKEAQRFSVAKTQHSYSPLGLAAVCASKVYSLTPNMRQAYAASIEGGAVITGARDLDRERLRLTLATAPDTLGSLRSPFSLLIIPWLLIQQKI